MYVYKEENPLKKEKRVCSGRDHTMGRILSMKRGRKSCQKGFLNGSLKQLISAS
jgi:hypothetical protein